MDLENDAKAQEETNNITKKEEKPAPRTHFSGAGDVSAPTADPLHMVDMDRLGDDVDPLEYGIEMEPEPEYQYGKSSKILC